MIIRSQDNKTLINFDRVGAIAKSKDNHIVVSESVMPRPSEILDLGQYSTEAKAIKALDMIQSLYDDKDRDPMWYGSNRVFQMPSDEEVEV